MDRLDLNSGPACLNLHFQMWALYIVLLQLLDVTMNFFKYWSGI